MDPPRPHDEDAKAAPHHFASRWLDDHGDAMYSYAMARLGGNSTLAEDLVQEAMLAGIEGFASFQQKSAVQTWLISILRHKIMDHLRKTRRRPELSLDAFFTDHETLRDTPRWRSDAADSILRDEFREALDRCLESLTAPVFSAFLCCVLDDLSPEEACKILEISPTNLSVRLHRARLQLRRCLQNTWFRPEA